MSSSFVSTENVRIAIGIVTTLCVVMGPFTIVHLRREGITNLKQNVQIAIGLFIMLIGAVGYRWWGLGFTTLTFGIGQWLYGRVVWPAITRLLEHRFEQKYGKR